MNGLRDPEMAPLWQEHGDAEAWAGAAASAIATVLSKALSRQRECLLLLSGGSTPEPVYRRLAAETLDWSRVRVSLVDERYLAPGHPSSNARLIRSVFADGNPGAKVWPLVESGLGLDECVALANQRWLEFGQPATVVVFGMGEDGHTASLFPGAKGLDAALRSQQAYVAVDASACAGAGDFPRRITLTPHGWRDAAARFLLISGSRKRRVFERAAADGSAERFPINAAIDQGGAALHVHWSP